MRIDDIEDAVLMNASVEMVIISIYEQFTANFEHGFPEDRIIPFLNKTHALLLSQAGEQLPEMAPPYSLEKYITHYIENIHLKGRAFEMKYVPAALLEVRKFYGR